MKIHYNENKITAAIPKKIKNKSVEENSLYDRAEEFLNSGTFAGNATSIALVLVVAFGFATTAAIVPGLATAAGQYTRSKKYSRKELRSATQNLKRRHYIEEIIDVGGQPRVQLTKKGREHFEKLIFEDSCIPDPAKWDGKWRFVLFDIPVSHTKARDALRFRLRALGFFQYQKSVWVYPYPCEKEILFVADHFGAGEFVEILEVSHLTKDANLRKHFRL